MKTNPTPPETNQPLSITAEKLVWLTPQTMHLQKNEQGGFNLTIAPDPTYVNVKALNAFPRNHPAQFIQFKLTNPPKGQSGLLGMLKDLKPFSPEQQRLVEECLKQSHNHTKVFQILHVQEEYHVVTWEVLTNRGYCTIVIPEIHKNLYRQPDGLVLITDIAGNQYSIADALKLDAESLAVINMYT